MYIYVLGLYSADDNTRRERLGLWGFFTTFEVWGLESLMVAHRHGMRLQTMGAPFKPYKYFLKPQTPVAGPKNIDRRPKARKKIDIRILQHGPSNSGHDQTAFPKKIPLASAGNRGKVRNGTDGNSNGKRKSSNNNRDRNNSQSTAFIPLLQGGCSMQGTGLLARSKDNG